MKRTCPVCNKSYKEVLRHLSIYHNISSFEELEEIAEQAAKREEKIEKFRLLTSDLNTKLNKGEIKGEEYRKTVEQWMRENES